MTLQGTKVLFFAGPLYEDLELWYPKIRLEEEGASTVVAGTGERTYQGKRGYPLTVDANVDDLRADEFDGLVIPGGYAPDIMRRSKKLLQLTLPGVPDTYQGCELVALSLVDPDNRRPVDYEDRRRRLAHLADHPPRDLHDEKLLVTHKALTVRRQAAPSFDDSGDYQPLVGTSRHLVGFLRGGEVATVVTRAPKRLEVAGGWGDETFPLPDGRWRDELTGSVHSGGDVLCSEVLSSLPVALLRRIPG